MSPILPVGRRRVPVVTFEKLDQMCVLKHVPISPLNAPFQAQIEHENADAQRTPIVTALDKAPPIDSTTGTAEPVPDPAGTCRLTWYSPTDPGAKPEKSTGAGTPPMVTTGVVMVSEVIAVDAGLPVAGGSIQHRGRNNRLRSRFPP